MPCCVSGILLHNNSENFTDDDTLPDLPYEVKNLDKPQDQNILIVNFLVLIFHGANWQNMLTPITEKSLPYQAMGIVSSIQ